MIIYSRATRYTAALCLLCWALLLIPWPLFSAPTGLTLEVGFWTALPASVICFVVDTLLWFADDIGHNLDGVERPESGHDL
jgi:uncharacterized membrane protein